jgi:cytochrome c biogenesis protein
MAVMLTLSAILAALLLGSLIPQGLSPDIYMVRFGADLGGFLLTLGLDDIFRTRGFAVLGLILFAQLCVCTGKRVLLLRASPKRWTAGSVLLHLGLLVFLVSIGVSLRWGKNITIEVPEGMTVSPTAAGVPFDVRLERFEIDYYPEPGGIRQYRSEVTLLRDKKEIRRGSLEVNEPLEFEGAKIFQMSYGWLLEGSVRTLPDGKPEPFLVRNGAWLNWTGEGKEKLRAVVSADPDKYGTQKPEAVFLVSNSSGERRMVPVAAGGASTSGTTEIRFDRLRRYSGLQVKQDPGIAGIFSGLILTMAGLILRYWPVGGRNAG